MPHQDSRAFRDLICRLLPGLSISDVARPSGQRIVYFGNFAGATAEDRESWRRHPIDEWGDVVVKVSSGISPEAITYLQREIRILNRFDSNFYPTLHFDEVFSHDPESEEAFEDRLFVTVEEFVPSEPLSVCKGNYANEAKVVDLLIQLVHALRMLWDQKPPLIHRDIKPDNILIRTDGSAVIIDLGIVREEGAAGVTKTEWLFGPCTPQFSSPEQAKNDKKNISFKSDVFALGTLVHVLLTGANPFQPSEGTPVVDVLSNVVNLAPARLCDSIQVSQEFSALVDRMMQKEPYRRPRTPDLLMESLVQIRELNNDD